MSTSYDPQHDLSSGERDARERRDYPADPNLPDPNLQGPNLQDRDRRDVPGHDPTARDRVEPVAPPPSPHDRGEPVTTPHDRVEPVTAPHERQPAVAHPATAADLGLDRPRGPA